MTKKAKFPPWTTKKVPFCQMGSVRKDANLSTFACEFQLFFFLLAFQAWVS
jgi:hypothetical protein